MNWLDLSNDTIKKGLDSNNNRYLTFFCKDYLATFGIDINNNIGCGKCIDDYINKFKYYLKNEIMSNQEVKKPNTVLYLKDNFSPREIAGRVVDNNTLTNEDVLYVLEKHPTGAWFLEDFHAKFGNADPVLAVENAISAVKEAIAAEKKPAKKSKVQQNVADQAEVDLSASDEDNNIENISE
jgi:hypothetical protein